MVRKVLIAVILLAAVILGGSGCMSIHNHRETVPSHDANELALLHMQEKYAEKFSYIAPWGDSMTGMREFLATCDSLPGQTVLVQVENFKGEHPIYRDNYLTVKYQAQTKDYFRRVAADIFGDAIVHYEASKLSVSSDLDAGTSFDTFYADSTTLIGVFIEIKESNYSSQKQLDEFFAKLNLSQGQIKVNVVVVNDSVYGTLDRRELNLLCYRGEEVAFAYAEIQAGVLQIDRNEEG